MPELEMDEDSVPPYRCPRCGSHEVDRYSDSFYPPGAVGAYQAWKKVEYHCTKCDLWEEGMNGDPERQADYDAMQARWHNPEWKFQW
jgi:hypothetical protein